MIRQFIVCWCEFCLFIWSFYFFCSLFWILLYFLWLCHFSTATLCSSDLMKFPSYLFDVLSLYRSVCSLMSKRIVGIHNFWRHLDIDTRIKQLLCFCLDLHFHQLALQRLIGSPPNRGLSFWDIPDGHAQTDNCAIARET